MPTVQTVSGRIPINATMGERIAAILYSPIFVQYQLHSVGDVNLPASLSTRFGV